MPDITEPRGRRPVSESWRRMGWFVLLYLAGLAVTLAVVYGIRALIPGLQGW
jgi:hypothetical protein